MDMDEMLARALQAEEHQAGHAQQQLMSMLQHNQSKVLSVEVPQLQARARSLMPLQDWQQAAQQQVELNRLLEPGSTTTAAEDLVVQSMLKWFKHDFFSWVDAPGCQTCGGPTQNTGMVAPLPAEQAHGAGRVEAYSCNICGQTTRFPRYTDPSKLLETKKGRCGEWAHCFLLMLRAAGYAARHVSDNADHVWNEYWSEALGRWVHVDSCEAAWDTPLLYEGGWGKRLAFVFGACRHGHTDVTKRYVVPASFPQLISRRAAVPEPWLSSLVRQMSSKLRSGLSQDQRRSLALRDAAEALQLMSLESEPGAAASAAAAAADLPGRQSGAEAWRSARGETGSCSAAAARPAPRAPTAYTYAQDTSLSTLFTTAGRVTGGVCRASGEHGGMSPSQIALRLFDGSLGSKWLDFGGGGEGGTAWVEYRLPPSQEPVVVTHYDVISAEDCPERDPCDWVLEAAVPSSSSSSSSNTVMQDGHNSRTVAARSSNNNSSSSSNVSWVVLDKRSNHKFVRRHQLCSFEVAESAQVVSRQWRLSITSLADPAAANSVQLACWNLYSTPFMNPDLKLRYVDASMCQHLAGAAASVAQAAQASQAGPATANGNENSRDTQAKSPAAAATNHHSTTTPVAQAAAPTAANGATHSPEAVGTLKRVLSNMQQQSDSKYWKVSTAAVKLQAVLADPLLAAALMAAGFRPVLQAAASGEQQGQLSLVADDSSSKQRADVDVLLKILDGSTASF